MALLYPFGLKIFKMSNKQIFTRSFYAFFIGVLLVFPTAARSKSLKLPLIFKVAALFLVFAGFTGFLFIDQIYFK
jgi:hypothetical protein